MLCRQAKDGFTFIEIIIAIAIVAIMAVVVVPAYFAYIERAKRTAMQSTLRTLGTAIDQFNLDTNRYPESLRDLVRRPTEESTAKKWIGPYLRAKEIPDDPWGSKYQYKPTPGAEHRYELYSFGPNGRGAPRAEWISVWDL